MQSFKKIEKIKNRSFDGGNFLGNFKLIWEYFETYAPNIRKFHYTEDGETKIVIHGQNVIKEYNFYEISDLKDKVSILSVQKGKDDKLLCDRFWEPKQGAMIVKSTIDEMNRAYGG